MLKTQDTHVEHLEKCNLNCNIINVLKKIKSKLYAKREVKLRLSFDKGWILIFSGQDVAQYTVGHYIIMWTHVKCAVSTCIYF